MRLILLFYIGWTGADCSEKLCPFDLSWFAYPEADNVAHLSTYAECSNQGLCDRITGKCSCTTGFTGKLVELKLLLIMINQYL